MQSLAHLSRPHSARSADPREGGDFQQAPVLPEGLLVILEMLGSSLGIGSAGLRAR
jgi:hypothetical protein